MIVVDSSVLVDFFRGKATAAVKRLRQVEKEEIPFYLPVICCQELLQGAKDLREWRLLETYLGSQRLLAPGNPWATHREAARIFFDCRRKGVTIRGSIDCLIAQLALEHDGTLLHDDDDFEKIRKVRRLKTLRK